MNHQQMALFAEAYRLIAEANLKYAEACDLRIKGESGQAQRAEGTALLYRADALREEAYLL